MAGHSPQRLDVWTDAGRASGDMFLIAERVSPSQAYSMQRWLRMEGWLVEVKCTEATDLRRRST